MIQVFQNLVSNALKYRRNDIQPVVNISARQEASRWVFSVKDNGIGIQPEDHQHIFDPFHQIEPSRAGGVGLGLATTKRMVEQHGGDLWLQSDGANGSEFFFSIPSPTNEVVDPKKSGVQIALTAERLAQPRP